MSQNELTTLREAQRKDQSKLACAAALLDEKDAEKAMAQLLSVVNEFYGSQRAYLFEIDESTATASNIFESCQGADPEIQNLQDIPLASISRWIEVLAKGNALHIPSAQDIDPHTPEGALLKTQGIDTLLLVPVAEKGHLLGFFGVDNPKISQDDPELLLTVSRYLCEYFKKSRVVVGLAENVTDLQKSLDMSQLMFQCAQVLLEDVNTDQAITRLLQLVVEYLGADNAYIFEYNKKERLLANNLIYKNLKTTPSSKEHSTLNEIHLSPVLSSQMEEFFNLEFCHVKDRKRAMESSLCQDKIFTLMNCENCILAPFQKNGEIQGFLGVNMPRTNTESRKVISTVAAFVVNALEKRGFQAKLDYLSMSDGLTGLKNRNAYLQKLQDLKSRAQKNLGVIFVDINQLKTINELFGDDDGDALLLWTVKFLQSHVRDPIYRIGGDEFVCFISGISQEGFMTRMENIHFAQERMTFKNLALGAVWHAEVENLDDAIFSADKELFLEKTLWAEELKEKCPTEEEKYLLMDTRMKEIYRVNERNG